MASPDEAKRRELLNALTTKIQGMKEPTVSRHFRNLPSMLKRDATVEEIECVIKSVNDFNSKHLISFRNKWKYGQGYLDKNLESAIIFTNNIEVLKVLKRNNILNESNIAFRNYLYLVKHAIGKSKCITLLSSMNTFILIYV